MSWFKNETIQKILKLRLFWNLLNQGCCKLWAPILYFFIFELLGWGGEANLRSIINHLSNYKLRNFSSKWYTGLVDFYAECSKKHGIWVTTSKRFLCWKLYQKCSVFKGNTPFNSECGLLYFIYMNLQLFNAVFHWLFKVIKFPF